MEQIQPGVYREDGKIYTRTRVPESVYGEEIVDRDGENFREWKPDRSKAGAAVKKGVDLELEEDSEVLYLGAASGTTVSHFSDIAVEGFIVAVEYSETVIRDLLGLAEQRENIAPVLGDARKPGEYADKVGGADVVFQDISQRDQAEMFLKNCRRFLKDSGTGLLAVKARSISTSEDLETIFSDVKQKLSDELEIVREERLEPYEKEHLFLKLEKKGA
ncbi:MAG: fibrillarin-like rRNA/tRNA 2'-O-methyltransferase [Candidatus Nanohaloarchaea archaeon]